MIRPGDRLRAGALRVCSAAAMERLIDPLVSDLQTEYADALRHGHVWKSRRVRMAGYVAFVKVMVFIVCEGSMGTLNDGRADERQALRRTIGFSISSIVVATMLLSVLSFTGSRGWTQATPVNQVRFLLYVVPSALPIAFPVGLLMGILQGLVDGPVSRRAQGALLLLAIVCSVASFATQEWLIPAGSQAYWGETVARDQFPSEISTGELRQRIASYRATPMAGSTLVRNMKLSYHLRWALSGATLVFALVGLSVVAISRVWRSLPVIAGVAVCFGYYMVLWKARTVGMSGALSPFIAAWLPNVVFFLIAAALLAAASRFQDSPL